MNDMLKNNEVPDSIKSMLNNFNSNGMSSIHSTEQPNSENNSNDSKFWYGYYVKNEIYYW